MLDLAFPFRHKGPFLLFHGAGIFLMLSLEAGHWELHSVNKSSRTWPLTLCQNHREDEVSCCWATSPASTN